MRLKIAQAILTIFGVIAGIFLFMMIIWGLLTRPAATLGTIAFMSAVLAMFWALIVVETEG